MLKRFLERFQHHDNRIFYWFNRRISHSRLDRFLALFTHMGGAVFTIMLTLSVALFASEPWSGAGWQSFAALSVSFLITTLIKKKLQRIRPCLVLDEAKAVISPLWDPSFPSGHSTAVFSVITPFLFVSPWLTLLLVPLAATVGLSRIYLGMHYPSDCLAGCFVGTTTALFIVYAMGMQA
ncbi:phosphatase PAP2 family protein [Paenibacillus harenae]|uniref:phosphatase PAP2 family protein n=1 Tax=Paenibacillus harenae TaxID=306543 RepID=UPI00041BBE3B|nr:phosphatase PAP2 family protein [Paenibacillus harenae]